MNTLTINDIFNVYRETPNKYIDQYAEQLIKLTVENGINTTKRQAMFLAQVKHESSGLRRISENLNYSSSGLLRTFGKYFNSSSANAYARQPSKIANRVYANRMGNGSESSGDGWRYRGRGLIQLTGKDNYTRFSKDTGIDAVNNPDVLLTPTGAVMSAIWFWNTNNLNDTADRGDIKRNSELINGGHNGLTERIEFYHEAKRILGSDNGIGEEVEVKQPETKQTETSEKGSRPTVRVYSTGSKGAKVKKIQKIVGVKVDGNFGTETENAVKEWQDKNDLVADGLVGPNTLKAMGL